MCLPIPILACCLFLALALALPASRHHGLLRSDALPWCVSTTDSVAQRLIYNLTQLGTSTDSDWVTTRGSLAHMPVTPVNEISMVGDEALCQRASQMLDSIFFTTPQSEAVYVARVGDRYAVYPPGIMIGEFSYMIFTDSAFQKLATITW